MNDNPETEEERDDREMRRLWHLRSRGVATYAEMVREKRLRRRQAEREHEKEEKRHADHR